MVKTKLVPAPAQADDVLEEMCRETEAILVTSARLIKVLEELLERGRQLRAAQAALLEQREKNKRGK